ncbi:class I SAM-dependent methyltransferase [Candidatus Woesearchaeota archaeon]|nr:class I SAM-dependent methyltransferase [Candidatus Woesearchaeota archaeon]
MKPEYRITGEHLKKIDPNWTFEKWSYRHTFVAKMKYIDKLLSKISKTAKIFDAGCGQGLLVNKYSDKGFDISGMDIQYQGKHVKKGNILNTGFQANHFDLVLNLDVIEHLVLEDQEKLIKELHRILKTGGTLIIALPNLAHLSSRFMFFFTGRLIRTAKPSYHPGDRPLAEYIKMLKTHFKIKKVKGVGVTIPVLFQLTQLWPAYFGWLYKILGLFAIPSWCFDDILICEKK